MSSMYRLAKAIRSDTSIYTADAYKEPFIEYMDLCYKANTVEAITLGQDPYKSYIFPEYALAFAFDRNKLRWHCTPSVEIIGEAVMHQLGANADYCPTDVKNMFERSYVMVKAGILFINASYNYEPYRSSKCRQMVMMADVMRDHYYQALVENEIHKNTNLRSTSTRSRQYGIYVPMKGH